MNRIILIGNGFDLAHGLPTRYEDFINWYWERWGKILSKSTNRSEADLFCSFDLKDMRLQWREMWRLKNGYVARRKKSKEVLDSLINDRNVCTYEMKSVFFSRICNTIASKGWVDIEWEYYDLLRKAVLKPGDCEYSIKLLNKHLRYMQELLAEYLSSVTSVDADEDKRLRRQIYGKISKNDISIAHLPAYYDYIEYLLREPGEYRRLLCRYDIEGKEKDDRLSTLERLRQYTQTADIEEIQLKDMILPENVLLLNFNYTGVADKYVAPKVAILNHIHGDLSNPDGMIFGYGDELDDDYKDLLKQSDNECLRNIKSIKYLESSNYRDMLYFIESAPYQVYVMGHSCGNSDRTLLNTLFEHKNCVSIKPYYHRKRDGSDNYLEIVQNICRNFTDMKLTRDRVVNKIYCEPLPQASR